MNALLSQHVGVARRFTRSVRLDTDLGKAAALEGFICTQSAIDALLLMARHRNVTGHAAFTWTGPYGSGKSSLAIALAAILADPHGSDRVLSGKKDEIDEINSSFCGDEGTWAVAPVVGYRGDAQGAIESGLTEALGKRSRRRNNEGFSNWVARLARSQPGAGIALIIDEMGKFLENAALDGGDIHVFQDLAEISSRSEGRLIVIGILHQAFDEYAHRLSRQSRDEWLKIQGRYLDLSINLASDEQIELIAQAIQSPNNPAKSGAVAKVVASAMRSGRVGNTDVLARRLDDCWPLHPLTAAMLGPISRRRFGQSQRSIFGFLTSAEPFGFQDYLGSVRLDDELYGLDRLWDYLRTNLEPAILSSPDGHRWSTAVDAVERCQARGGNNAHTRLIKSIAMLDLFKDRSGLQANQAVIRQMACELNDREFKKTIDDLIQWSVVVFRKHSDTYAIYAGSDFDIEQAVDDAYAKGIGVDYRQLAKQAALQPVLAKRHYEDTGALRWFEVDIAPLHEAQERVEAYKPAAGSAGLFLILVSANAEQKELAQRQAKKAAAQADGRLIVLGWTHDSYLLREMARELAAMEYVRTNRPELEGDPIARREIDARIARLGADLDDRLSEAIGKVDWILPPGADAELRKLEGPAALTYLASRLADWRYPKTPQLRNELLNRTRPSSNANAASRALARAMVEKGDQPRLGFEGYPPEAGLYASLLEATNLHRRSDDGNFQFGAPVLKDPCHLLPVWTAADDLLNVSPAGCTMEQIFAVWRAPPIGIRDGLLPVLGTAYLLSRSNQTATYLDEVFRPHLDGFAIDRMFQEPAAVRVRFVELTEVDAHLISALSKRLSTSDRPVLPSALEVARALVRTVKALPHWVQRTTTLSREAAVVRDLSRHATDPNQLLLEDLPSQLGRSGEGNLTDLGKVICAALGELEQAYPMMLNELASLMLSELRSPHSEGDFGALHRRANVVRGLSGNFRLDAFANRLSAYQGELTEMEDIASLVANKPPRAWVDRDIDAARLELADLAQQFLRAEGLAHVKGRPDERIMMSVYVSDPSYPAPVAPHFQLSSSERAEAVDLGDIINVLINSAGSREYVAMGALARLSVSLAARMENDEMKIGTL